MERSALEQHLKEANAHVALGEMHISRQRRIIAAMEKDGHDTAMAMARLHTFEVTQAMYVAGAARLAKELAAGG